MAVVSMIEGLRTLKYQDIENGILEPFFKKKEGVSTDEIGLKITKSNMILPCGVYGRWECNEENS